MSNPPIAVITGASSGIGAIYARRLAERGHSLVLVARRADRLEDMARELAAEFGVPVRPFAADLTDEAGLASVENLLRSEPVDMLINNAGMGPIATTEDLSDAAAAATLTLNVEALMRLARAALPGMRVNRRGGIVNIGSVMAFHAMPVTSLYSATKAFVLTYSRAIAREVEADGVRVQAVLPAGTVTDFYETAGVSISDFDDSVFMTPEQLVDAALLGFDRGEEVTLPSVHNAGLWEAYDAARENLFAGTQNGSPASRYRLA